jgi:hypothetical protein
MRNATVALLKKKLPRWPPPHPPPVLIGKDSNPSEKHVRNPPRFQRDFTAGEHVR